MSKFLRVSIWSLLWLIIAVIFFYQEEDWRGALAWTKAKAEIAAQGESLDPGKFIPPPVPDAENFGALPVFRMESNPAPTYPGAVETLALDTALERVSLHMPYSKEQESQRDSLPYLGNWQRGEKPDLPAIQPKLSELCHRYFPASQIPSNAKPTDMFELLCPVLADFRATNVTHPLCRFEHNYATELPVGMSLGSTVKQITVVKVLAYEERLALLGNQPDLAFDDLKVSWKIESGLRKEPILVSGLVSAGVVAIQLEVIREGLAYHAWTEQQLEDIDNDLGKLDYLAVNQFDIRGEVAFTMIPSLDFFKTHRGLLWPITGWTWSSYLQQVAFWLMPQGWLDQAKADYARCHLLGTIQVINPHSRRVFPKREANALSIIQDSSSTSFWRQYALDTVTPTLDSVEHFAYSQVRVDETRIACRLERYRLAHGTYPTTLDALVPAYGSDLPHDIMNGDPYHYKLNGDGTYMLYSVGWDQKDDGGQTGPDNNYRGSDNLDWIWTNYPDLVKAK